MFNPPAAPCENQRNIVLTGFMGTGKTTVGRILARKMRRGFLDTDAIIEQRHGPITEIFATQGEDAFRVMEQGVAAELGSQKGLIVATGGRLLLDPVNIAALGESGYIYGLSATVGQVYSRINQGSAAAKRPLLAGPDPLGAITALLGERAPQYRRFPQVAAGTRRADTVASEIIELHDRPPTPLQSSGAAKAIVGINLLSQLRGILNGGPLRVLTTEAHWRQYGPIIGNPDELTLDANPDARASAASSGPTVLLGGTNPEGAPTELATADTIHVPTDWPMLAANASAPGSMIIDLAALQPAQPQHRELSMAWDRVMDELGTAGWVETIRPSRT